MYRSTSLLRISTWPVTPAVLIFTQFSDSLFWPGGSVSLGSVSDLTKSLTGCWDRSHGWNWWRSERGVGDGQGPCACVVEVVSDRTRRSVVLAWSLTLCCSTSDRYTTSDHFYVVPSDRSEALRIDRVTHDIQLQGWLPESGCVSAVPFWPAFLSIQITRTMCQLEQRFERSMDCLGSFACLQVLVDTRRTSLALLTVTLTVVINCWIDLVLNTGIACRPQLVVNHRVILFGEFQQQ